MRSALDSGAGAAQSIAPFGARPTVSYYDDPSSRASASAQPVQPGDVLTLEVERLGDDGDGLCRVQNYVIWVPGALAGETVVIEIESAGRKNARAILLDAPCSGTGTLRRHPDIKILRQMEDLPDYARLQRALLEFAKL